MKFIPIPNEMKQDDTDDFSLVEIINGYPHCKEHGAMNRFENGLWRCLSMYSRVLKEGETMPTFRDRICCACCFEDER